MRLSLPKPRQKSNPPFPLLLPASNPLQWDRLPSRISSFKQFQQFLSRAFVSGLFQNPNLWILNSTLKSLAFSSSPDHAIHLYDVMRREGISPDNYTLPVVLKAVGRLCVPSKGQQLHSLSLKQGFEFDVFVQNSLVNMYSVCRMVGTARRVFEMLPDCFRDVVSWNSVMSGYLQRNLWEEALGVFRRMVESPVKPDAITLVNALIASGRIGAVCLGKIIHALAMVNGFASDLFLGSSLTDMYAKCGLIEDAHILFNQMPQKNVVSWTAMISGHAHSGRFKESVLLFREMQMAQVKADEVTMACVISACAHLGALDHGKWVHAYCDNNGISMNLKVQNALIDMYMKCGDVDRAVHIFHGLVRTDIFSWTVIIHGLAMNGYSTEALELFTQMELSSDVAPNEITFLGVLSACSHGGHVEEGCYYFHRMTDIYNLTPEIQHFGCIVDLLGRANLLVEAEQFIKEMPIKPDVIIWRSLLFACRINGNIELAEFAVERIMELNVRMSSVHVLLSNVYASATRWSDSSRARREMNSWGISKHPGCSYVEVNGSVHEFFATDTHQWSELIHFTLLGINKLLGSERYVLEDSDF